MPCGAVPITHVEQHEQIYEDTFNDRFTKPLRENMEGSVGLPVGV